MKKNIVIYTLVSYIWSYFFWILAILISLSKNTQVLLNERLAEAFIQNAINKESLIIAVIALVATWGPMVGSFVVSIIDKESSLTLKENLKRTARPKYFILAIGIFLAIGFLPSVPLIFVDGLNNVRIVNVVILFFFIQVFTSGLEEIGWRGYMLPEFLKENDAWSASFKTGIIWALWHLPVVAYIFYLQGMPVLVMALSFIGFSAGIVASSVIHTYFFIKTKSLVLSVFIHAIGNTIPLATGLLIMNSYKVAIFSQLLIWVVVWFVMKDKEVFQ